MTATVSCPSCDTSFPIDPAKVPLEGVRAQCSNCPEIFDVDRPSEATPEAPPVAESTTDTTEASDPLDAALIDPPPVEEAALTATEEATGEEPADGDVPEPEDFGDIDMAIEPPVAAEADAEVAEAEEPAALSEETPESPGAIRFGKRSAEDKAKSLARSLVSDLIAYNPDKHKEALAAGTLQEVFGEEIDKSLKEYQEQVDPEVMAQGTFFNDALNSILAEEQPVFTLDD